MKTVLILFTLMALGSCATMSSLGDQLTVLNSTSNDVRVELERQFAGKTPTEVKKMLGIPSNQGLVNHLSKDPKNKDFALIYAAAHDAKKGQKEMRANYNLNKEKRCMIFFFQKKYKYRFNRDALHGLQSGYGNGSCSAYKRWNSWRDMTAEEFEKKSAYFMN